MSDTATSIAMPEPGRLQLAGPPHGPALSGIAPITVTFLLAAAVPLAAGVVLFGWPAVQTSAIAMATALLVESTFNLLTRRSRSWAESHALLIGALVACTLPPTVHWQVPVLASAIAILVGLLLPGGVGHYLWHPAAIGRVAVQILFHDELMPARWPVLASGRLLSGSLSRSARLPPLASWADVVAPEGVDAWLTTPVIDQLREPLVLAARMSPAESLAALLRDGLPPWLDSLTGVAGGTIGGACVLAVLIGGLLLLWRGFVRWPMVAAALASAGLLAAVLPVPIIREGEPLARAWLPGLMSWQGYPVGLVLVAYQLTAGGLPLVLLLLAPDPSSSPLTTKGFVLFGVIIGGVTMVLRVVIGLPAASYWALLVANTMVPGINRLTRRRVLGT